MFDIGFWELTVIGVIALLVVGPERLPAMARTMGLWVGRIRRYVSHVRDDIEREIQAEELRELMKDSQNLNAIGESLTEAGKALEEVKRDIESDDHSVTKTEDENEAASPDDSESMIDAAASDVGEAVIGGQVSDTGTGETSENSASSDEGAPASERRSE